jgi:hypothetical protein
MIFEKLCQRCQKVFETSNGATARYCSSACRQAAFREREAAADGSSAVTSDVTTTVTQTVTPELVPLDITALFRELNINLATPEDCTREIVRIIGLTRVGKMETHDMVKYVQSIEKLNDILERRRQIELANEPIDSRCVDSIEIISVPEGCQVVSPNHAALIRALKTAGKIEEAWQLTGEKQPDPELVSDIVDPDSGRYLDPTTLTILPPLMSPSPPSPLD